MSVVGSNILAGASGGEPAGYRIERSVRLVSDDSAYLSKTFSSAGNRKTWTWSGWIKRSGTAGTFLGAGNFTNDRMDFSFNTSGQISLFSRNGTSTVRASLNTDAAFEDFSAWYHVIIAFDASNATAADRIKIYVNGVEQSITASTAVANVDHHINNTLGDYIGTRMDQVVFLDAYVADVYFIDGQTLDETSFGEFDDNNVWQPIRYEGTYGTNGYHLDFSDNSSASALGTDSSGNSNTFTVNNISVASGAGNDSLLDSPINYIAASGNNGGNYAVLHSTALPASTSTTQGSLEFVSSVSGAWKSNVGTMGVSSGKWYFECAFDYPDTNFFALVGVVGPSYSPNNSTEAGFWNNSDAYGYYSDTGNKYNNSTAASYGATYDKDDVIGIALDLDAGTIEFFKNNTSQGDAYTGITDKQLRPAVAIRKNGTAADHSVIVNFGQRPFTYTPPSGHKAWCTQNLADPDIEDGSTAFTTVLYTGNGGTQTISGLNFSPDLVWFKQRNGTRYNAWYDTVRGVAKALHSNANDVEFTSSTTLTAFNSDGFDISSSALVNENTKTYAAWAWDAGSSTVSNTSGSITSSVRASTTTGVSIVSYTGDGGTSATIGHGLSATPEFIIVKNRDVNDSGAVYHKGTDTTAPEDYFTRLFMLNAESAVARSDTGAMWNDTAPTDSVFSVGTEDTVNAASEDYIAWCFAPVDGYSAFGSFVSNGAADNVFVHTGFRPAFILGKISSSTSVWFQFDTARNTYNPVGDYLRASQTNGETALDFYDITSNGFKVINAGVNAATYLYAAFAEHPFKTARAR